MERNISILNYGCTANYNHGEIIAGELKKKGLFIAYNVEDADIIIINSCIVKSVTENKIKSKIKELTKNYPEKLLILTGCAADVETKTFQDLNKNMILVSSHHTNDILKAIENKKNYIGKRKEDKLLKMKQRKNELINIVEISQGCLGNCTFCITKTARGKLESYESDKIIKDIRESLKEGCKEIWLTSQDCGCYGFDINDNLCNLLDKISEIEGNFRVRVGMSNPQFIKLFPEKLAQILKDKKIFRFLHIPVQSGSDNILNLMKRGHSVNDFKNIINISRKEIPDITISTDVIVGFPGENEDDFRRSIELLEETKPDIINISKFGARPGTEAKRMKQLDTKIIKERTTEIGRIVVKIKKEKNAGYIGNEYVLIIDERGKKTNQWMGRTENYKLVIIESEKNLFGKYVKVKITGSKETHLIGKIIRE